VTVDLEQKTVTLADGSQEPCEVEPFARYCLLNGVDELAFLLGQQGAIEAWERAQA
jgi:3-isopropylmalate/(R)-2-methylmalate dehydratase small subunit